MKNYIKKKIKKQMRKIIFSVRFSVKINCLLLQNHSSAFSDVFPKRPKPPGLALEGRAQAIHAGARNQRVRLNIGFIFWKTN